MRASMKIGKLAAISLLLLSAIAATDVAPSNAELEAMYDRAFRAFDAAEYGQALKELDAIDARKPDLAASQNLRGVIYLRQGIYDKAEAALSESQRLDPKFWNARFNLAEIPFLKKDWAEARKRFQELLSNDASDLQGEATQLIQYKILLTYLLEQNETMVDSILAKFELSPDTPAVHYANAAIALQRKNVSDARKWMTAAERNFSPQLNKLFAESIFEVGWLQQQPGQQRTALQLLSPEEQENGTKAIVQANMEEAQQAYEQRDFERASRLAEQADAAQPNQAAVLNLRGEILLEQGKFADAEEFFSKALKADSKFREAQFNQADVPFRQKDYAKARDRFQALLKQTPGGDKNQAAQLINFKIYMTYLLEGKDSRAQKLMEQFQFTGDTPALYYANAAWEFKHGKTDTASDWIASARKIYPLASNAAYSTGFYDLGWLKTGATVSPAPSAATNAAAVASAQNESPAPAIEPSPIPGAEAKGEGNAFVSAQTALPSSARTEAETSSPSASAPATISGSSNVVAANAAGSPAPPGDVPALPLAGISPVVETPSASVTPAASLPASTAPVNLPQVAAAQSGGPSPAAIQSSPSATAAPSAANKAITSAPPSASRKTPQYSRGTTGERLENLSGTLLWVVLLVGGVGMLAWVALRVITPEIRRRMSRGPIGQQPAPVTGPQMPSDSESTSAPLLHGGPRFSGGPRQVSVQLKASEPIPPRPAEFTANSGTVSVEEVDLKTPETIDQVTEETPSDTPVTPLEPAEIESAAEAPPPEARESVPEEMTAAEPASPAWEGSSRYSDFDASSVGPVVEQNLDGPELPVPSSDIEPEAPAVADGNGQEEPMLGALRTGWEEISENIPSEETVSAPADLASESAVAKFVESTEEAAEDEIEPEVLATVEEPVTGWENVGTEDSESPKPTTPEEQPVIFESPTEPAEPSFMAEPIAQGQPVPYQTVAENIEATQQAETAETTPAEVEAAGLGGAIAGLGALRGAMPSADEEFSSQPNTINTMPETQTAPVIRTPAGSNQPSPNAPAPHAAAAGVHTAVHITLSCEIASMQLTPTFKMGALQLRPTSKVVTMRLAPSQQQQKNGMNLANFEIAKVQPAPGSLGQIRLSPSQQQKPATLNTPSFNVSGLQVVSGFEDAPLQLTPSQQGQASVHLTAAFQITTVEFSPTFDVAAMILNSSAKTVSVQLPAAVGGSGDNGPLFEITNVQLTANGEIGMLQLNPATARRG